jgi:hypothetical protein
MKTPTSGSSPTSTGEVMPVMGGSLIKLSQFIRISPMSGAPLYY